MVASTSEKWRHEATQKLDSQQVKSTHRGAAFMVVATLSGTSLLLIGIMIVGVLWYLSFLETTGALDTLQLDFRRAEQKTLALQIAEIIRPTWSIPHQLVYRMRAGREQLAGEGQCVVIPPRHEDFTDPARLERLMQELFPFLNREGHMRSSNADRSEFTHGNVIGVVIMLALQANNEPAWSPANCRYVAFALVKLDVATLETYTVDGGYVDENSSTGIHNAFYKWDPVRNVLGSQYGGAEINDPCARLMGPLWFGQQLEDWFNFTYFGPFNPNAGWGNHLIGSVPIYNDAQAQVGRVSVPISLGRSIGPILRGITLSSEVLKGGEAALYTESGLVLGLSEKAASSVADDGLLQVEQLDDLAVGSKTEKAVVELRRRFGTPCPGSQEFLESNDFLIDVQPFVAEDHGMPPLPERWCQMVTLPRDNIFQSIDEAVTSAVVAGVSCIVISAVAMSIVVAALVVAVRTQRRMKKETYEFNLNVVRDATESMSKLTAPLVVVSAEDFLARPELECYEKWRNRGRATVLDSLEDVEAFKALGNLIVFFSHQWLGWKMPDNEDNAQLQVMHRAVRQFIARFPDVQIYVWVDYVCIAQQHAESQAMAVAALPVYVSLVDHFVVCAPTAEHRDTRLPVGLDSYARRGWCRAEMLAKACSGGIENMFICEGEEAQMRPFTQKDMEKISLSVYEGNFTVQTDAEKLVVPILGLYSLILNGNTPDLVPIRQFIEGRKSTFFPHSYKVEVDGVVETRKLFGELVQFMEEHVSRTSRQISAAGLRKRG